MKMKKALAAALAGVMVLGTSSTVFAITADEALEGTAWWTGSQTSSESVMVGDGTWTAVLTDITNNWDEDTQTGGAFGFAAEVTGTVDESYAVDGDATAWLTSSSVGDCWTAVAATTDEIKGSNSDAGVVYEDGVPVYVEITRSGQDFVLKIYEGETAVIRHQYVGTNMPEETNFHIQCQTGSCVANFYEGSVEEVLAGTATDTNASSTSDTSSDDTSSDDTSTADDTTSSDTTETTGDAAPIVAVVVALAGCAAIAFASKKRFAK